MPSELRRRKLEKSFYSIDADHDDVIYDTDVIALAQMWCDIYDLPPRSPDWTAIHAAGQKVFREMPGTTGADGIKRITMQDWLSWADDPAFPIFVERAAIPFSMAVFGAADKDNDNRLTAEEMNPGQAQGGMSDDDTKVAFDVLDRDRDGYVTTQQYIEAQREFYLSDDPDAPGNLIAGPI
ncbi:MAG: hypothetical protein JO345_08040 [Streptosporangiaceae bacterium]|nr:hypothetical protein [Streptosporangiaceae bacterium]